MEKIWFLFSALILGVLGGTPCQKEGVTSAPGRCSYYHVCQNGTLSVEKCPFAHRFDPVTKSCTWFWKVNCTDWASECEEGNLYSHPESCRAYYSCFDRRLKAEFCPFLYAFDGQKCSFMSSCNKAECKESEVRAVDCSSYDVCHNGKWTRKGCGLGRSFDIKEKRCVFGRCGQCTNGVKEMVDGACHRYKECVNGEYVEKSCGLAKMFNSTTQTCEWFFHVDCAPQNKMCSGDYTLCGDKSCVSYHVCKGGKLETQKCGIYRRFDLSRNTCVFNFFTNLAESGECRSGSLQPDADCRNFQKCVKGQWVVENCPEGQAFDYRTNMCQFQDSVQCSETSCINGQKYIMKNDCYKYYECVNNQKVIKDCYHWYNWMYFDPNTKECTRFWKSFDCSSKYCKNGEKRETSNKYIYEMCMDGEWVRQECLDGFDPIKKECPDWTKNMLLVLSNTKCVAGSKLSIDGYCRKYKQCNKNGEYVLRQCSKNTVFDPQSLKCREDIKCPVYTPLADRCDEFLSGDRVGKCLPGDKFDWKKLECVDHAMGHCLETNCDGISKKNHEYDCTKYYQCENSIFVEKKCPWGKNYDAARQDCYLFGAKCAYDKADCQSGFKKTVDCQQYAECKGDHYEINSCWWLRRFDMSKQQCGWKWNVKCDEMQSLVQTCTEGEKEVIPNTCRYYRECENNNWKTKMCSPCQNFNTDTKECDYVWKKPCSADVTDPTLVPTDPTPTPTPSTTTQKRICNEGEKRGIKGDCKKYEECSNNAWVTSECFWFRKFDINSLRCVYTGATCA